MLVATFPLPRILFCVKEAPRRLCQRIKSEVKRSGFMLAQRARVDSILEISSSRACDGHNPPHALSSRDIERSSFVRNGLLKPFSGYLGNTAKNSAHLEPAQVGCIKNDQHLLFPLSSSSGIFYVFTVQRYCNFERSFT
jgi:hypothetical protein